MLLRLAVSMRYSSCASVESVEQPCNEGSFVILGQTVEFCH